MRWTSKLILPAPEGPARTRGRGPSPSTADAWSPDADAEAFFADADAWWVGTMMKGAWITIVPASLPVLSESVQAPLFMLISRGRGWARQGYLSSDLR